MKYYGTVYGGANHSYELDDAKRCDDPYEALKMANEEWNSKPENQVVRLLTVLEAGDDDKNNLTRKAYFQFTDSEACDAFIRRKAEIRWASQECQDWNGNSKVMG